VACLQDPTFGTTSDLRASEFIQGGAGHAFEIDTPGTYDLQDITFTGYGGTPGSNETPSSGAADAAIFNSSGGVVTINVNGSGNAPSIRNNAVSTTTVVTGLITLSVTVLDKSTGLAIGTNARVQLLKESDKSVLINAACNGSGVASTSISYDSDTDVIGWAREMSLTGTDYTPEDISGKYTSSGLNITVSLNPIV
jgi:hypothetical protein